MATRRDSGIDSITFSTKEGSVTLTKEDTNRFMAGDGAPEAAQELVAGVARSAAGEPEQTRQLLMAMCATCAHTKASHPEEGPCGETWVVDDGKREVRCRCSEYWATRRDLEDGLPVTAREIWFSGGTDIELNRRITAEFWDGLRQGRGMTVLLRASVVGKKFREKDYGLTETRQLRVDQVFFVPERREVGEPSRAFDSFGNEVDPETGEILGGGD